MAVTDRIDAIAAPLCERIGVELVDVEYEGGVLRLVIDHPDGVGMDAIAGVTREVSRALDHEDPIPGTFTLEVTSPGLERSLKRPVHFERAIGCEVAVKTQPGSDGPRRVTGVLEAADGDGIEVRSADGSSRVFRHDEILNAHTVFVWTPEPKSGRKGKDRGDADAPGRDVGS
jgi:ribosome maturation factor RimP